MSNNWTQTYSKLVATKNNVFSQQTRPFHFRWKHGSLKEKNNDNSKTRLPRDLCQDWFIKIATPVVTWSHHVVNAIVSQDRFIKIAIPVRTGHVWTSKISFVRVPDTVAALKGITLSILIDHCEPNKYPRERVSTDTQNRIDYSTTLVCSII